MWILPPWKRVETIFRPTAKGIFERHGNGVDRYADLLAILAFGGSRKKSGQREQNTGIVVEIDHRIGHPFG